MPVANPATALDLIHMAWKLNVDQSGRVLALLVTVTGTESTPAVLDAITAIVEEARQGGIPVELVTRTAPNVARGILDAALEYGATLLILGFQAPNRGPAALGPIVEAVARTTPCDLVVYRNPSRLPVSPEEIERVVLPLDGSENSKVAARLGLTLSQVYEAAPVAFYVQTDPGLPEWMSRAHIEASLAGLDETRRVQRQVVRANDIVSGILTRCGSNDLIVLGFSEQSSLDRWIFGDVTQRMLARASGPVVLAKRAAGDRLTLSQRLRRRWVTRLSPTLTPSERLDMIRQAAELGQPGINFVVLMVLSSMLASFGLLQSSAAVIIGAMLVAPLMSPLMSFSIGLLQGHLRLMRTAAVTVLIGVLIALGVSLVGGLIMPLDVATAEMLSRGRPSLLDLGVALASGAAGAYAMARKDIPSALVGVAIAAALVPPLCTVGLALAFGKFSLASGAGLLFLTNVVSITLAGVGVFAWLGLVPPREARTRDRLAVLALALGLLVLPLASTFLDLVHSERDISLARHVLQDQFDGATVISVELKNDKVLATVRGPDIMSRQDVETAQLALEKRLGHAIDLEIIYWRTITP